MLSREAYEDRWKTYIADTNGALLISLHSLAGRTNTDIKLYSEIIRKPTKQDNMSAKQIVAYVASKF